MRATIASAVPTQVSELTTSTSVDGDEKQVKVGGTVLPASVAAMVDWTPAEEAKAIRR